MTTDSRTYREQLLLALRLRDVPGARIGEALAEVESHVAETGEDPVEAFGPATAYADALATTGAGAPVRPWWRWLTGADALVAVTCGVGGWLLASGVGGLSGGTAATFGLPAPLCALVGAVLLLATGGWLAVGALRGRDRVMDPRTGMDMAPPMPRWAVAVLVLAPALMLALSYLVARAAP